MYMVERMEKCMDTFEKDIRRANRSEVFMDMPAMAGAISGTRRQLAIAYVAKLMFISEETCVSVVVVSCLGCLSESKQPKCGVSIKKDVKEASFCME
jgi:hypothetical protein